MTQLAPILLIPGGSPHGLSYWSTAGECPRKWHYKSERLDSGEKAKFGPPGKDGKLNDMFVGTLFHAYAQHGMNAKRKFATDEGMLAGYEAEEAEAWRLVQAYRKTYRDWETPARSELDVSVDLTPMFRLTGRVDALVWIEGEIKNCDHVFQPGTYIWDYKTASKKDRFFVDSYRLQIETYALLWNENHPNEQVLGGVLDRITKTKEPECDRFFIPMPTERRTTHVVETWYGFKRASEQITRNLSACVDGYRICEFKKRCDAEE